MTSAIAKVVATDTEVLTEVVAVKVRTLAAEAGTSAAVATASTTI